MLVLFIIPSCVIFVVSPSIAWLLFDERISVFYPFNHLLSRGGSLIKERDLYSYLIERRT